MIKRILWVPLAILSVIIGLYPGLYFIAEKKFGLLKSKPDELFSDPFWRSCFYIHISLGGLALLIGWLQFSSKVRNGNKSLHRVIGKIYIVSVLLSALAGFYIALYANGGLPAALGFISLSIIWFYTTLMAYLRIRNGQRLQHKNLMTYSYACCFAAVTLRLWLPLLGWISGNFEMAYIAVAWWCWLPNLAIAYWLVKKSERSVIKAG